MASPFIYTQSSAQRKPRNSRGQLGHKSISLFALLLSFVSAGLAQNESKLDYTITLTDADHHRVHVKMTYDPENGGTQVQLPVWNALYQVRDFSKNLLEVKASDPSGEQLPIRQVDKTTWEFRPHPGWVTLDYDIIVDEAGPFNAQFNAHHAFFNLAEALMYPVNGRELPIALRFEDVPANWKLATPLPSLSVPAASAGGASGHLLHAANYDRLVDSPCELGQFDESDFDQEGAHYRVVIDADPADYDAARIVESLKKITATETAWMQDRPFDTYVFIYHFPRAPAGGGMEHAYSTAIDHSASELKEMKGLESVSAHEFFHLWNVKRIRPQSLEPINYASENYTRALWFSEGVTSTVADLTLLKAGLLQPAEYLDRLASSITVLQSRPAHLTQSAEESSLDTWLDKYPSYHAADRSISYYDKGDILGVLLDLKIREDSRGRYSLRDLFQAMNRDYAKQGRYFPDSEGVRSEAEKLTETDFRGFFLDYVAGTRELPYDQLLATVGLKLEKQTQNVADPGFAAARNFTPSPVVESVYGAQARSAGIQQGDLILAVEGKSPGRNLERQFASAKPGAKVRLTIQSRGARKDIDLTLESRSTTAYVVHEAPQASAAQIARRRAWLNSEDQK